MYYLLLIIFYPISLLPMWLLYRLADVAYLILYYLMGYRRQIVYDNLKHAFPNKTDKELIQIQKANYKHFCDQWIETLKLLSISRKELDRRVVANWEVFQRLGEEQKNTYALMGHTFNWEWANVACAWNVPQLYACIYLPLSSSPFDKMMLKIRSQSGALMISMKALKKGLVQLRDTTYILGQAADQNPSVTEVAEWLPFMNREAPFFRGTEQMARRAKAAVVFVGLKRVKRGYYEINLQHQCDDASLEEVGSILKSYVNFMEQQLTHQPENWMWTHRRWKHQRQPQK